MPSTELLVRPLPQDILKGAGLQANGSVLPRGARGAAPYSLLSVDRRAATSTPYRPSPPLTAPYRLLPPLATPYSPYYLSTRHRTFH